VLNEKSLLIQYVTATKLQSIHFAPILLFT